MRDKSPVPAALTDMPAQFPGELMIWLSASFPVGGFVYSQGLETAVERGWIGDRGTLESWLSAVVSHGPLANELAMISLMLRAPDDARFAELAGLSAAMQPSSERSAETLVQGRSFAGAYQAAWAKRSDTFRTLDQVTLPAALAAAAREHALPLPATLEAYAIAHCSNLVSAAIRLGVIGQFDGQRIMAALLPCINARCAAALTSTEDDLGTATYGADLAAMLHEIQTTRLFRS